MFHSVDKAVDVLLTDESSEFLHADSDNRTVG